MIQEFKHMGHRIEVYSNERECNWFLYSDCQFLEKGKGYEGNNFYGNGCLKDAVKAASRMAAHSVIKRRLGKFGQAFQNLK